MVIFSHMKITHVIFTCEDIQFSRKSLPGISLVFILEELSSHQRQRLCKISRGGGEGV